ncbi:MAG: helix-turn-helix domain-containing protein, partial [Myxococcota bacterium]
MRRALIEAAAPLFARRAHVSVRTVAEAAGVNHGLVHRYFGSKRALRRAVLEHLAARLAARMKPPAEASAEATLAEAFTAVRDEGLYWRALARTLLDASADEGDAPATLPPSLQSVFPVTQALVDAAREAGHPDPRAWVAGRLALGLGWLMFGPFLRA